MRKLLQVGHSRDSPDIVWGALICCLHCEQANLTSGMTLSVPKVVTLKRGMTSQPHDSSSPTSTAPNRLSDSKSNGDISSLPSWGFYGTDRAVALAIPMPCSKKALIIIDQMLQLMIRNVCNR